MLKTETKLIPEHYNKLTDEVIESRIAAAKRKLGSSLVILGHHYQKDDVIQWADYLGDSLKLCQLAASHKEAKYIVFCGVHFMAESADLLSNEGQIIILPDLKAGCSMADMAHIVNVKKAWLEISSVTKDFVPVTYINSAANLKAFCGKYDGIVCTSSNAGKIVKWAFDKGKKVMFFPDEHLGRYTALQSGVSKDEMIVWDPQKEFGGNSKEDIAKAKVILWKGYCYVHQDFKASQVDDLRKKYPGIKILVHPECNIDVINKSDYCGSTNYIIDMVSKAEPGTTWAIGTETHLVERIKKNNPDKKFISLSPEKCLCSTMYRISKQHLLWSLESILKKQIVNKIKVPDEIASYAKVALDRMMLVTSMK